MQAVFGNTFTCGTVADIHSAIVPYVDVLRMSVQFNWCGWIAATVQAWHVDVCCQNQQARLPSSIQVNLDAKPLLQARFFDLEGQIAATVQACDWKF